MIEPTALLNQIEQLILKAKQNPSDANVREQLTAVRALCDVVLQAGTTVEASFTNQVVHTQGASVSNVPQQRTLPKRAEIEQQNDSIFDF